jgi:hypothetical protein
MEEFLDQLHKKAQVLFTTLAPVAFVLMVVSLWSGIANNNRSATMYLQALIHLMVVAMLLSQIVNWLGMGEQINAQCHGYGSDAQCLDEMKLCGRAFL